MDKRIILPMDGYDSAGLLISDLTRLMLEPHMAELVSHIKLNDANFLHDTSAFDIINSLFDVAHVTGTEFDIFADLKCGDVSNTLSNIATHFASIDTGILTVSAIIASRGFLELRKKLPYAQLALFSVPTDMSEEECKARYNGLSPAQKIEKDISHFQKEWETITEDVDRRKYDIPSTPFDMVVCSPRELDYLYEAGWGESYSFICPGIRDEWMADDHQKRTTGVLEALEKGAEYVVMGTQILKGNPAKGISAEESRKRTIKEIEKFHKKTGEDNV